MTADIRSILSDPDRVRSRIADVAARIVLPKFRNLSDGEVREKGPGDLVTDADEASEAALTDTLTAALPGSVTVGEETVAREPDRLTALEGTDPVWIIDPIDGTRNFAKGVDRFAVIVALALNGRTEAGWIHEPTSGSTIWAVRGQGAHLDSSPVVLDAGDRGFETATGSFNVSSSGRRHRVAKDLAGRIGRRLSLDCAGYTYRQIAVGALDFALFNALQPWDHAAGALIVEEAGGTVGLTHGIAYTPRHSEGRMVAAVNRPIFEAAVRGLREAEAREGLEPG